MAHDDLTTRVERDIAAGDLGMASRRLASALAQGGYDAAKVAKLARIHLAMQNPYEAGRFFVVSTEGGAEVDAAIDVFMRRNGNEPTQIVSQLPMCLRLSSLDEYPTEVVERLRRLGLDKHIRLPESPPGPVMQGESTVGLVIGIICGLLFLVCLAVGVVTVLSWIFGWLFPPIGGG